jgi:hypothetical protein
MLIVRRTNFSSDGAFGGAHLESGGGALIPVQKFYVFAKACVFRHHIVL